MEKCLCCNLFPSYHITSAFCTWYSLAWQGMCVKSITHSINVAIHDTQQILPGLLKSMTLSTDIAKRSCHCLNSIAQIHDVLNRSCHSLGRVSQIHDALNKSCCYLGRVSHTHYTLNRCSYYFARGRQIHDALNRSCSLRRVSKIHDALNRSCHRLGRVTEIHDAKFMTRSIDLGILWAWSLKLMMRSYLYSQTTKILDALINFILIFSNH